MRYRILQVIVLCVISVSAFAQDRVAAFITQCTETGKSNSFCHCALNAMSDQRRSVDKRKIANLLLSYQSELDSLLADPVMTQDKVDAACDLYDAAMVQELKESQSSALWGSEESRALVEKKLALLAEREKLVMSYQASRQVNGSLIQGDFCADRHKITQMQQYLAEEDTTLYGYVREMLSLNPKISLPPFLRAANSAGCQP